MNWKVNLALCIAVSAIGFGGSFWYFRSKHMAEAKRVRDEKLEELHKKHEPELTELHEKQAKVVAEWDRKIALEGQKLAEVKAEWDKRNKLYDESGYFALPMNKINLLGVSPFESDPILSKDMRTLLKLTPAETKAIDEHTLSVWKDVVAEERKHAKVMQTGSKLLIDVQPYPEAGRKLEERFWDGLLKILGPKRAKIFDILNWNNFHSHRRYFWFGKERYRMRFKDNGNWWHFEHQDEDKKWKLCCSGGLPPDRLMGTKRIIAYKPDYFKNVKE